MSVTTPIGNHVAQIVDVWVESSEIFVMADAMNGQEVHHTDCRQPRVSYGLELHNKNEGYFAFAKIETLALTDAVTVPRSGSSLRTLCLGDAEERSSLLNTGHRQLRRIQQAHLHEQ